MTLLIKKTRKTGDKRKEGLAFTHQRVGQQQHKGETHKENDQREEKNKSILYSVCYNQTFPLGLFRNLGPDSQKATVAEKLSFNRKKTKQDQTHKGGS